MVSQCRGCRGTKRRGLLMHVLYAVLAILFVILVPLMMWFLDF